VDILILTPNFPRVLRDLKIGLDFNDVGYDEIRGTLHTAFPPGLSWNLVGALLDEEWVVGHLVRKVEIMRDPLADLLRRADA